MAPDRHQSRILNWALAGDAESFAGLCNRYADALYRYLYFRLGSIFAAEEVSAQVFVRSWETLASDPRRGAIPFANWIFQVANDVVQERNERFSRQGLHPPRPPLIAWSGREGERSTPQLHPRYLAQAIMGLDNVAQQVIALRFVIRMSHRDVALVIGDTATGSRVLQYRAFLELHEALTRKRMGENAYASDYVGAATFCLDRIISGRWGAQECLEHIPHESERLEPILDFAVMVREASAIKPSRTYEDDLKRQLLADFRQSRRRPRRQPRALRWFTTTSTRIPPPLMAAFILGLILLVGGLGVTGLLQVVDHAAPGDRFYDLDLRLERTTRAFFSSPDSRLNFALNLTEERLSEAERLARRGDSSGLRVALVAYSVEVSSLARQGNFGNGPDAILDLDTRFAQQQQRLDKLLVTALTASFPEASAAIPTITCDSPGEESGTDFQWHPVGLTLAAQHEVAYQDVMEWVCTGHSFGEIVLALASTDTGATPTKDVLLLKSQLGGWGQLWDEMANGGQLTGPPPDNSD